ncbi:MAG: hypothetical protein EXR98_16400 [Gemmataceae bacterium]|nr:hypothetical protein [Gemmataceae bacterium]
MFDFCPHCGQTLEHEQVVGRMLVCAHCGKVIGFVGAAKYADVDETEELIRDRTVARCPVCRQAVEVKAEGDRRTLVPHYSATDKGKICLGSGKAAAAAALPVEPAPARPGKDLSAYMTRDILKVVLARRNAEPTIEVLTLEYLDKTERVRIQIEALREMLGTDFRMQDYPTTLNRPHLGVWASAEACVVARKHEQGGYQSLADGDVAAVLADLGLSKRLFLP